MMPLSFKGNAMRKCKQPILRVIAAALMAATLAGPVHASDDEDESTSPGAFPYYEATPTLPGFRGERVYLMPDGGTWTIGPPVLPGVNPPPIYTAPPDRREDVHIYIHNGRQRKY